MGPEIRPKRFSQAARAELAARLFAQLDEAQRAELLRAWADFEVG